jgi:hypothetical protein
LINVITKPSKPYSGNIIFMSVITIREQQQIATGFAASLSFGDGEYDIIITDPFTPQEERELEWYFEE